MHRFLVDTQLPPLLSELLNERGFDSKHTATDFPNGQFLTDESILEIATEENRIVITKDKDFKNNYLLQGAPPKVLFIQLGNSSNSELLNYFRKNLAPIKSLLDDGHYFITLGKDNIAAY